MARTFGYAGHEIVFNGPHKTEAELRRALAEGALIRAGDVVLDLACGTGIVARLAAPLVGAEGRIVGIDMSAAMIAVAGEQPAPEGAPIEWREGDAAALPFDDASFDAEGKVVDGPPPEPLGHFEYSVDAEGIITIIPVELESEA